MISLPRIERYGAICRPDVGVVYAGRRAVRISWWNSTEPQNPPVKIIVASADAYSSRVGDDCCRTLQPLQASGSFFDRGRGTRPVDLNFFGPFKAARRFFCTPLKFCQEPRGRFTNRLKALSCLVLHGPNHGANDVAEIRKSLGEVRNVVR